MSKEPTYVDTTGFDMELNYASRDEGTLVRRALEAADLHHVFAQDSEGCQIVFNSEDFFRAVSEARISVSRVGGQYNR